ncbi:MAG TPA: hypothetical protein PKK01_16530 [Mycobacterium sp.]|nr:hypothetical protein [Mycobacterium sp.]HPZ94217.1 hypothetical protein [Mycobacterium sp.]HQE14999.1 hypothetical protein [Mycobacterium sp.]
MSASTPNKINAITPARNAATMYVRLHAAEFAGHEKSGAARWGSAGLDVIQTFLT